MGFDLWPVLAQELCDGSRDVIDDRLPRRDAFDSRDGFVKNFARSFGILLARIRREVRLSDIFLALQHRCLDSFQSLLLSW
ncbi:MAG: hypothetical protein ACFHWZ_08340 [Phycisphaerales bacterium]